MTAVRVSLTQTQYRVLKALIDDALLVESDARFLLQPLENAIAAAKPELDGQEQQAVDQLASVLARMLNELAQDNSPSTNTVQLAENVLAQWTGVTPKGEPVDLSQPRAALHILPTKKDELAAE